MVILAADGFHTIHSQRKNHRRLPLCHLTTFFFISCCCPSTPGTPGTPIQRLNPGSTLTSSMIAYLSGPSIRSRELSGISDRRFRGPYYNMILQKTRYHLGIKALDIVKRVRYTNQVNSDKSQAGNNCTSANVTEMYITAPRNETCRGHIILRSCNLPIYSPVLHRHRRSTHPECAECEPNSIGT